jgi:hypothetical protein
MRNFARCVLVAAAGVVLALITTTVYGAVTATNTPSGSVTGGANVLKPGFDFGAVTNAWIDDGDDLSPGPAKLNPIDQDIADAKDANRYEIIIEPVGLYRMDVHLTGKGTVTVLTEFAPGDTTSGSYTTDGEATYRAEVGFTIGNPPVDIPVPDENGNTQLQNSLNESISSDDSGNITRNKNWAFADKDNPRSVFLFGGAMRGYFFYEMSVGVALKALREEVVVGGGASSRATGGKIEVWDISVVPPVRAKKPNGDDAVWTLQ